MKNIFLVLITCFFISCGSDEPEIINTSQGNNMPALEEGNYVTIDGYNLPKSLESLEEPFVT